MLFLQLYPYFAQSIAIIFTASLIYSLLSLSLITFLLNIIFILSPPTFKQTTISPFLDSFLKKILITIKAS